MTASPYNPPQSDPRTRLLELLEESTISPEIAMLRLAVLRQDAPKAVVQIDSVRADDTAIAVKVTIGTPNGGRHSEITAIDVDPERSWSEQHDNVQAIAIARALDGLGVAAAPTQLTEPAPRAEQRLPPAESPVAPATAPRNENDHLAEYSWTSFWQSARSRNITKEQVEQALGKSIQESTPKEALEALEAKGM